MTERAHRDVYLWIDAHREALVEHAMALAELAEGNLPRERELARLERIAFETAAALEALDRVYPRDHAAEDDTIPFVVGEGASS